LNPRSYHSAFRISSTRREEASGTTIFYYANFFGNPKIFAVCSSPITETFQRRLPRTEICAIEQLAIPLKKWRTIDKDEAKTVATLPTFSAYRC
jgi:hypothetical protein